MASLLVIKPETEALYLEDMSSSFFFFFFLFLISQITTHPLFPCAFAHSVFSHSAISTAARDCVSNSLPIFYPLHGSVYMTQTVRVASSTMRECPGHRGSMGLGSTDIFKIQQFHSAIFGPRFSAHAENRKCIANSCVGPPQINK